MTAHVQQSVISGWGVTKMVVLALFSLALTVAAACSPASELASEPVPVTPPVAEAPASQPVSSQNASEAALKSSAQTPVVVFLGDSLTAGFGLSTQAALPEQVQKVLQDLGQPIMSVNAGVSGDTTANGLARYNWSVRAAKPDMLVVALGANDYLMNLDPSVTEANLAAILEYAQSDGLPVILAGLQSRALKTSPDALGARDKAFAAIYPTLSARYNVPLYPALLKGVADNPALLQADGLHPTEAGVALMAETLAPFLAPQIAKLPDQN